MQLIRIKESVTKSGITLKELSEKIDMTYQNLNRCIRENKITANDLEKISSVLAVPVTYFFDDPATLNFLQNGSEQKVESNQRNGHKISLLEIDSLKREIEYLKREISLKDKIIDLLEKNDKLYT